MSGCSTGIGAIEVKAPNGKPSILFDALTDLYQGDLDSAYRDYLLAETRIKELLGGQLDVNGEPMLADVQRLINPMKLSKPTTNFLTDTLKAEEALIREPAILPSGDQANFYTLVDAAGNVVKELARTAVKISELAFGKVKDQADQDWQTTQAIKDADVIFKGVPKGEKVTKDGIEYSYQEYVDSRKRAMNRGATRGTLVHLKIQEFLARAMGDKALSSSLQDRIVLTEQADNISSNQYDWVTDKVAWKHIVKSLGIRVDGNHPTKVYSELRVGDPDLGMASTIDIAVEDPLTGKIRIGDFKTTQNFNDSKESNTMIHGRQLAPIYNTAKNRARLQVVLNAVAIKAKHPQAQFESPVILWLPNEDVGTSGRNTFDVDVRDYLRMVEQHYKNEHPESYKALMAKSPNLFNAAHYGAAVNTSFAQDMIDTKTGMRDVEMLQKLKLELEMLELEIQLRPGDSKQDKNIANPAERERREELLKKILQAESTFALPTQFNSMHDHEIGMLVKWFGVLSDTNNPYLKSYSQSIARNHAAYNAEHRKIDTEFNVLLQNAVTKVFGKQTAVGKGFTSLDKSRLWDQLIDRNIIQDESGQDRVTVGMKTEASPGYAALPSELKDLSKFMRTNMRDVFEKVLVNGPGAVVVKSPTGNKTKLDLYNDSKKINFQYEDSFIPKMGVTQEEMYQRFKKNGLFGKGGKEMIRYWKTKYLTDFVENNIEGDNQQDYGIPIKYVGTANTITAIDTHSLDLEQSFKRYMEGMLTKKHYDNAFATGIALSGLMRQNPNAQKSADFLEHAVYRDILKRGSVGEDKLFTNSVRVAKYNGQDVYLSTDKVLKGMSRGVASIGLWLNTPSMFRNAVQAEWAVQKEALMYGMLNDKWSNVSAEDKDLTYKNFLKAKGKVAKMQADFLQGNGRSNPIHIFMKEFDLYPQITEDSQNLVTGGKTMITTDHLTAGYQHAEDMTTANLMVTAMLTMKVKSGKYAGKSMWEMYENSLVIDQKTGFGTFKLPADFNRGKLRMGDGAVEQVTGLHPLEIQRLRSMTRKLKGGYRKEERSRIEATYLGEAFMLFKRWLPQVMIGNYKGKMEDITVGSFNVIDQQNGEDIMEWKARVVEGRLVTLFHTTASALKISNTHKWEDLSSEQKKNLMDTGVSFMTWAGIAIMISALYGDDEDKETKKFLLSLDARMVEHVNPISFTQLQDSAILKSITGLMEAFWQMSSGATMFTLTGDEDQLRTQKGDIRGLQRFKRNLPFGAAVRSAETYLQD